jgi:Zn-dependent protease with chaperone function
MRPALRIPARDAFVTRARAQSGAAKWASAAVASYAVFLLAVIIVYYSWVTFLLFLLLDIAGSVVERHLIWSSPWLVAAFLATPCLLFVLTRLSLHLWRGLVGLVTQKYDTVTEPKDSMLLPADRYGGLYAVVAEVGDLVMSPTPDEIRLTHEAACYAVELRSFAIHTDRKLVLVIGLPQLEVMSETELKVIVAHELAHFGGGDTRLGVFVYRFLETLREAREDSDGLWWRWIDPVAWLAFLYFHFFLLLSAPIRKHQEFRADGWSASAFGGDFAARTLLKDWLLERQFREAVSRFRHSIPRNAPHGSGNVYRQFATLFQDLTPEGHEYLERRLAEEEQSTFWDSHPTTRQRMANMRRYPPRDLPEPVPSYRLLPDIEILERKLEEELGRGE